MIRTSISAIAYNAVAASSTRRLLEARSRPQDGYYLCLAPSALDRLTASRWPDEGYSATLLRLSLQGAVVAILSPLEGV
jgi:hypothetical protein